MRELSTMRENDDAEIRQRLLALRDELQRAASAGADSADVVELDQARVGRLSRMDAMQAQAMSQASARRRDVTLNRIAAALLRLERGDYGYCLNCDDAIARKRLEFDPVATLCITCAERAER
jgi:RNA polymerase-binding transcription factor